MLPIYEATRKSDLYAMILRGNHKLSNANINAAALGDSIDKEVDHGWSLTLAIYLVRIINNA